MEFSRPHVLPSQRLRAITGEIRPTCENQPVSVFYARKAALSLPPASPAFSTPNPKRCPPWYPPFIAIGRQDPISQFFVRNPRELFHKEPEAAVLDSTNELVREIETGYHCRPYRMPYNCHYLKSCARSSNACMCCTTCRAHSLCWLTAVPALARCCLLWYITTARGEGAGTRLCTRFFARAAPMELLRKSCYLRAPSVLLLTA